MTRILFSLFLMAAAMQAAELVVGVEFDADTVFGIYAPAGTPKDAIAAQEMVLSPEAFAARLRAEHERMRALIRETGLRAD